MLKSPKANVFKGGIKNNNNKLVINDEVFCKDLSIFEKYDVDNILLIDNKCMNYHQQPLNGFPVLNYDHGFILKNECRLGPDSKVQIDLTLYRLELFLNQLDRELPIQQQNRFSL